MTKKSLIITAVCWTAALVALIWMSANHEGGPIWSGLFCAVVATPFYIAIEILKARKRRQS